MRTFLADLPYKPLRALNGLLAKNLKMRVVRDCNLYPWQLEEIPERCFVPGTVPTGAAEYLRPENMRLKELEHLYRHADQRVTSPAEWTEGTLTNDDLLYFRGQNPFVSQIRGLYFSELSYALSYYALKCGTARDLLTKLDEDGLFGAFTFLIDGRSISRDLLDSVREIEFIQTHADLDAPAVNVLDIGAGYGRLVHRLKQVTGPNVWVYATDAFAPSTFICEYYLRFRNVQNASVVPLTQVEALLANTRISLAVNVHSFSECTAEAIDWWVSLLARYGVPRLMIIPNPYEAAAATGACLTSDGSEMEPILAKQGYHLRIREPRFSDPVVQRLGIDPSYLSLFELK